ncbi:urate hydroxylase PuuD [Alteromonas sp. NFXS44]|uniref:urate hydroxylase PuuD n=1 Tax=Alteromonas sp. NFXS44 TaxID=2818435 RepID=UPI0032DF1016
MEGLDWLSLFVRWFHVIAGVAWIGASFYFIWLDNSLRTPPEWKQEKGIKGDLWAIHGGGFYEVAKYAYGPESMPATLHWFKWEAYTTWLSGFALLIIVYYFGASAYLIDPSVNALSPQTAILSGLGIIFGGLALYELACRSPLAKSPKLFALFLIMMICFASWLTTQLFSGRGAYIHVGALVGTIMVANVFLNIMPNQRKMVAAVAAKGEIDPAWGASAKLRSVHNNYLTLPLLFIMISNHYPMTYQHPQNWLVLIAIMALSAWIRHFFNLKHQDIKKPSILVSGAAGMLLLAIWVSMPVSQQENTAAASAPQNDQTALSADDKAVQTLITTHCTSCHAASPTDDIFKVAPLGVKFDSWQDIKRYAPQIYQRSAVSKDMPFMNKTGMTDEERQVIAKWFKAQ